MKRFLVILAIGGALLCFTAGNAYALLLANFQVYNESGLLDGDIYVDEDFTVEIYVQGDSDDGDLASFGFEIDPSFSLSNITLSGYTIGDDYDDFGLDSYVSGMYWPADESSTNAGENVLLASLSFSAIDSGLDTLYIEGLYDENDPLDTYGLFYGDIFSDPPNQVNESIQGSLDIEILGNNIPVPEPATMVLLGTGLIGLAGFRKIRFKR